MGRSCALLRYNTKVMSRSHVGHFKVKHTANIENIHFLSILTLVIVYINLLKGLMFTHMCSDIVSTHIFRTLRAVTTFEGVIPLMYCLYYTSY